MATIAPEKPLEPTVEEDIQELRRLFQEGYVPARDFFREVHARHGDRPELAYWNRILMPTRARKFKSEKPARDLIDDFNWIKAHAHAYYGEWLALIDGQLLAHGPEYLQVEAEARRKSRADDFLMFHAVGEPR
jgi:hypothetical protein